MKFSICILVFNAEQWIEECLDSCIQQSIPPFEIIISNDASSDASDLIIQQFIAKNGNKFKFKYFFQKKNIGISANTKFIVDQAAGDIIFLVAGDDLIMPNFLASFQELLNQETSPHNLFFMSSYQYEMKNKKLFLCSNPYPQKISFFKNALKKNGSFIKCGVSRNLLIRSCYPANLGIWADWAWDVDIAAKNPNIQILVNHKPGYIHRLGSGVSANTNSADIDQSYLCVAQYIWMKFKVKMDILDKLYVLGEIYYAKGRIQKSFKYKIYAFLLFLINIWQSNTLVSLKSSIARYIPRQFIIKN